MSLILKSKALLFSVIGGVAAVAAGIIIAVTVLNKPDSYRFIKVFELQGQALISRADIGEINAYSGMSLESGDSISVGDGSFMRLSLDDDKYILIEEGTKLSIEADGDEKNSRTVINLTVGAILNEISNKLSDSSSYEVNTPKSTMSVRGTAFRIVVERVNGVEYVTSLQTFDGAVGVKLYDKDGNETGEEVVVPKGKCVEIKTNKSDDNTDSAENGYSELIFEDDVDFENLPPMIVAYIAASADAGQMGYSEEIVAQAKEYAKINQEKYGVVYSFGFDTDGHTVASISSDTVTGTAVPTEEVVTETTTTAETTTTVATEPMIETTVPITTTVLETPTITQTPASEQAPAETTTTTETTATAATTTTSSGGGGGGGIPVETFCVEYKLPETTEIVKTEYVAAGGTAYAPTLQASNITEGYDLAGWYCESPAVTYTQTSVQKDGGVTVGAFSYSGVTQNMTVYPTLMALPTYTITYYTQESTGLNSVGTSSVVVQTEPVTATTSCTASGLYTALSFIDTNTANTNMYTFGGWYLDPACTTSPVTSDTVISANTNVYAKYIIYGVSYSITASRALSSTDDIIVALFDGSTTNGGFGLNTVSANATTASVSGGYFPASNHKPTSVQLISSSTSVAVSNTYNLTVAGGASSFTASATIDDGACSGTTITISNWNEWTEVYNYTSKTFVSAT